MSRIARTARPGRVGRLLPLVVWVVGLIAGTALFHAMGDGPLAPPPLSPSTWGAWLEGRDPLVATVAVLRLVVLGLSWYLVGATSIGILARVARAASLVRVADALTVPALRRLLQGALGMSLATAMVTAAVPVTAGPGTSAPVVASTFAEDAEVSTTSPGGGSDEVVLASRAPGGGDGGEGGDGGHGADGDAVTMTVADEGADEDADEDADGETDVGVDATAGDERSSGSAAAHDGDAAARRSGRSRDRPVPLELLDGTPGTGTDASAPDPDPDPGDEATSRSAEESTPRTADAPAGAARVHVVVAGESLWTIAHDVVANRANDDADDTEVADYWHAVVRANRDRLDDPDNPDLIFPGQRLELPAIDGATT